MGMDGVGELAAPLVVALRRCDVIVVCGNDVDETKEKRVISQAWHIVTWGESYFLMQVYYF